MPTTIQPYAPSERAQQIVALAREALTGADEIRQRIRLSAEAALECGRLLVKERDAVLKAQGHGAWKIYFDAHFASTIPQSTAYYWMKMARDKIPIRISTRADEPNTLRNSVLALQLFPAKVHVIDPSESNASDDEPFEASKRVNHHALINGFNEWQLWFGGEVESGHIGPTEAEQILQAFEPVERFINSLRATIQESKRDV